MGERTGKKIITVLLDWEKAFDQVTRQGMKSALERMEVGDKMKGVILSLYERPTFKVEIDGTQSGWYKQETGIRQGCPLSPYLFLIVMTTMFHDIHFSDRVGANLIRNRVAGMNFDEILYADDTICISEDTRTMYKLLAAIEEEETKYGLKLNKAKCEAVLTSHTANVHFANGEPVKRKEEVKYLGCVLQKALR